MRGTIRKTEISYAVARGYKNRRSVFFFHASDTSTLAESYTDLLFEIGHDALTSRYPSFNEAHSVWVSMPRDGQLDAIKRWLGCAENEGSVIIFDDLDGLKDIEVIWRSLRVHYRK